MLMTTKSLHQFIKKVCYTLILVNKHAYNNHQVDESKEVVKCECLAIKFVLGHLLTLFDHSSI